MSQSRVFFASAGFRDLFWNLIVKHVNKKVFGRFIKRSLSEETSFVDLEF